ncbi:MAG: hypothetical protein CYPHOPRED_005744 [Cyphobasidiales sp. Tagirdzhanova-0007]|nr:MAG: hypothetical protein CYPHOPRED_005744 [Cyphobasidiales sp. Tagirdzhanova-0007]
MLPLRRPYGPARYGTYGGYGGGLEEMWTRRNIMRGAAVGHYLQPALPMANATVTNSLSPYLSHSGAKYFEPPSYVTMIEPYGALLETYAPMEVPAPFYNPLTPFIGSYSYSTPYGGQMMSNLCYGAY